MTVRAESPRQATVRILVGGTDATAGSGLFLGNGLIATCAHVVRKATGLGDHDTPAPGATVRLRFPGAAGDDQREPYSAEIVPEAWRPDPDVAVLTLLEPAPFTFGWTNARPLLPHETLSLTCFGYGDSFGETGGVARARVVPQSIHRDEAELLNAADDHSLTIEHGFSGGAVCAEMTVLGLLRRGAVLQGKQVRRMVLWRLIDEALDLAIHAPARTTPPTASAGHLGAEFEFAERSLAEASRRINEPYRRVLKGLENPLADLKLAFASPAQLDSPHRLAGACEDLLGLEECYKELRVRLGGAAFSVFGLGGIIHSLKGLLPPIEAESPRDPAVDNDWDAMEESPWRSQVEELLASVEDRLRFLASRPPHLARAIRDEADAVLRRLRRILHSPMVSLRELDAVRADLERLDRDVFEMLIVECQVVLGLRANRLPPKAVFRDRRDDGGVGPEMVVIPEGRFLMGSPDDEKGLFDHEGPRHEVRFAYRFALARYPVTFEEYDAFCAATGRELPGDEGWGRGRRPVINVSWRDASAYCAWLSKATKARYRLPSESEWEYACRAGTRTAYPWGDAWDPKRANGAEGGPGETSEVGRYPANDWGLFDTIGNVWEWVDDHFHDSYEGAPEDGSAWIDRQSEEHASRVRRGGSWNDIPRLCRAAFRYWGEPVVWYVDSGFRPARTL